MVDNSIWRTDTPNPGAWCWVTDGKTCTWPAYHDGKTWTNGDTWEDAFEHRVTGWLPIYPPGTVINPLAETKTIEAGSIRIGDLGGLHVVLDSDGQRVYNGERQVWPT